MAKAGKKVWAIPYDYKGACAEAADVCLGVRYFNWGPAYIEAIKMVLDGKWTPYWDWYDPDWKDINNPDTSAVGFVNGNALSKANADTLATFIKGLGDGSINLFTGPLKFQDGSVYLNDGEKATDLQIWYLPQLLEGRYWLEKRMMLHAELRHADRVVGGWDVVNEAVISRGGIVRPVQLTTSVDDTFLTTYVADGLIASTPTGSTGYALAAGGPILPPGLRNILIIPVAPHLSVDRGVVLAEGSSVTITVHTTHQAVLSIDGQPPLPMADGDCVHIAAGDHTLSFVHFQDPGYFYRNLTSHMNQNPSSGASR
jgi:hypothetical protein